MPTNFIVQSTPRKESAPGLHVAIIMDGNGRWADTRGWPRLAGHQAGANTVTRMVECAPGAGVRVLTLYAFSSDNWKRPPAEVAGLFQLFEQYLTEETGRAVANGVRVQVIGRRDRLNPGLVQLIERTEAATAAGEKLWVRIAVDYSSRDTIVEAAKRVGSYPDLNREIFESYLSTPPAPPVDLLIRTGGEQRLSDFLLWECAYAELWFTPLMFPDFQEADLRSAIDEFHRRQRRFGGLVAVPKRKQASGR